MTVIELIKTLYEYPDDFLVMVPNRDWSVPFATPSSLPATVVVRGCNEADRCVFIEHYEED